MLNNLITSSERIIFALRFRCEKRGKDQFLQHTLCKRFNVLFPNDVNSSSETDFRLSIPRNGSTK